MRIIITIFFIGFLLNTNAQKFGRPVIYTPENLQNETQDFYTEYNNYGVLNSESGKYHTGKDYGHLYGVDVAAVADGYVVFVRDRSEIETFGLGATVIVRHFLPNNLKEFYSQYSHLYTVSVTVGQPIYKGDRIGLLGNTGYGCDKYDFDRGGLNDDDVFPIYCDTQPIVNIPPNEHNSPGHLHLEFKVGPLQIGREVCESELGCQPKSRACGYSYCTSPDLSGFRNPDAFIDIEEYLPLKPKIISGFHQPYSPINIGWQTLGDQFIKSIRLQIWKGFHPHNIHPDFGFANSAEGVNSDLVVNYDITSLQGSDKGWRWTDQTSPNVFEGPQTNESYTMILKVVYDFGLGQDVKLWSEPKLIQTSTNFPNVCSESNLINDQFKSVSGCLSDAYISNTNLNTSIAPTGSNISINAWHHLENYQGSNRDVKAKYWFSDDATIDGSDTYLGQDISQIGSDAWAPISLDFDVPNKPNGVYYILVQADADNVITESDETNNIGFALFEIGNSSVPNQSGSPPDIEFTQYSISDNVIELSQHFDLNWTMKNFGGQTSSHTVVFRYLSDNAVLDANDFKFNGDVGDIWNLSSGASVSNSTQLQIPWDAETGDRYLILSIEANNDEINHNNTVAIPITIIEPIIEKAEFSTFMNLVTVDFFGNLPTTEGGFFLPGVYGYDPILMKVDLNGFIDWHKKYVADINQAGTDRMYWEQTSIPMPDGGALLNYHYQKFNGYSNRFFLRVDSEGDLIYEKQLVINGTNYNLCTSGTISANQIFLGLRAIQGTHQNKAILTKMNQNMNVAWSKVFPDFSTFHSINPAPDGSIYCVTNTKALLRINASGNVLWSKQFDPNSSLTQISEIGGSVYLTGFSTSYNSTAESFVTKINKSNGSKIWVKSFPGVLQGGSVTTNPYGAGLILHAGKHLFNFQTNGTISHKSEQLDYFDDSVFNSIGSTINDGKLYSYSNEFLNSANVRLLKYDANLYSCTQINSNVAAVNRTNITSYSSVSVTTPITISANSYNASGIFENLPAEPFNMGSFCGIECDVIASFFESELACEGDVSTILNTGVNGDSYTWKVNNEVVSQSEDLDYAFPFAGVYLVELIVEDDLGCTDNYLAPVSIETCCKSDVIVQNVDRSIYESSNSLITSGTINIQNPDNVLFRSQTVSLKPGMHVEPGSVFRAYINPCNN